MEQADRKHDVFVSYSHVNLETAQTVVAELERNGIKCWYANRDLSSGVGYAGRLTRAVRAAKVLLLVFSAESNVSEHVLNEVDIAFKAGRVIVPLRLSDTGMSDDMEYYLTRANWMDAIHQPLDAIFPVLISKVRESLALTGTTDEKPALVVEKSSFQPINKRKGTLSKQKLHEWANPPVVRTLEFLNTLNDAPSRAVDLSEEGNRSVLGWTKGANMYIAGECGVYAPEDCSYLFSVGQAYNSSNAHRRWSRLRAIRGGAYFDTSKVKTMCWMFSCCTNLISVEVGTWDICEVTNMKGMFWDCSNLTSLKVDHWDTFKVTDMSLMFCNCAKLTNLNVRDWDTYSVTNMAKMFMCCYGLITLDVSQWDTPNAIYKEDMFYGTRWSSDPPIK